MNIKSIFPKVAVDLYRIQFIWALVLLGFFLFLQIARPLVAMVPFFNMNNKFNNENYFDVVFISSNIFMLVIGIIVVIGFLPYFVGNGVTRKDYFKGASIAAIGLSISIPIVASIIYALQKFAMKITGLPIVEESTLASQIADAGDGYISELIQSIIMTPFIELESNWLLAILIFAINIFTYYLVGWLIGAGFYRFGVVTGLLSIALGFIIIYTQDQLLRIALNLPVSGVLSSWNLTLFPAIVAVLVLFGITLWIIRQFTKHVAIKM